MAAKKTHRSNSEIDGLARAAGLTKAVKQFPQDIALAAQAAASARSAAGALDQLNAEPWPPMRVRSKSP